MAEQRPIPSRMNLQNLKIRHKGAVQGHSLLKKKSDALSAKFRSMLQEIVQMKKSLLEELNAANFALAKTAWSAGDIKATILESIKKPAVTLTTHNENIAGVKLPIFKMNLDSSATSSLNFGSSEGGKVIVHTQEKFRQVLTTIIALASLQTAFFTLDEEIKMINRRVNALDCVLVPRLQQNLCFGMKDERVERLKGDKMFFFDEISKIDNTVKFSDIDYILKELDEEEREEFFRLKKIQSKKKAAAESTPQNTSVNTGPNSSKDDDILF